MIIMLGGTLPDERNIKFGQLIDKAATKMTCLNQSHAHLGCKL